MDALLVSVAQTSFNYLLGGAIIGGMIGASTGYFLSTRKDALNTSTLRPSTSSNSMESMQPKRGDDIAESIRKLSELRDNGILTEEEFQVKKTQLLDRL